MTELRFLPMQASEDLVVSGASNATPIVITTTTDHGMSTGEEVEVFGVLRNATANGIFKMTKLSATTFSLNGSAGIDEMHPTSLPRARAVNPTERTFPADTTLQGTIHRITDRAESAKCRLYCVASQEPLGAGTDVDVRLFGRPTGTPAMDWHELAKLTSADTWTQGPGGSIFVAVKDNIAVYPEMMLATIQFGGSTTTVQPWLIL